LDYKQDYENMLSVVNRLLRSSHRIEDLYLFEYNSLRTISVWNKIFCTLGNSEFITPVILDRETFERVYPIVNEIAGLCTKIKSTKSFLIKTYDDDIYRLNGSINYKKLTKIYDKLFARIFSGDYVNILNDIRVSLKQDSKVDYNSAVLTMKILSEYQENCEKLKKIENKLTVSFGSGYKSEDTEWTVVLPQLKYLKDVFDENIDFGKVGKLSLAAFERQKESFKSVANINGNVISDNIELINRLDELFAQRNFDLKETSLDEVFMYLQNLLDDMR